MKECSYCKKQKSYGEFYVQSKTKDGFSTMCKCCLQAKAKLARVNGGRLTEKIEVVIVDGVESKKCRSCGDVKPLAKFEKGNNGYGVGGRRSECMTCRNKRPNKITKRKSSKKTDKGKSRKKLQQAIKRGKLVKPGKCSICNKKFDKCDLHGHHEDYSKPLDVVWCCQRCHHQIHHGEY
jgi:hypothetical protein